MAVLPKGLIVPVVLMARKMPIVAMVTGLPDSPNMTERRTREK